MDNPEAKRFGRYEVVAELGRGAMGVVYKARDPQIDRFVAVKTVSMWGEVPEEKAEFRLRFLNEAQAAGRLHHAGIVSIFDVGEDPDKQDPYIVLEYVAGESLNRILARQKKLPLVKALRLAEEIAQALDYAHAQGVVHRDIKPGNILINEDGRAKIADFGIAKLNLAHFTLPGRVMGTPAYMAPEQLSGEGVDGRSDLFALGVILYAMVTGHSPFQGNSATTVCFKVANREPVAASALDLNLPPELDEVISRAMAKDPKERYQRGAEFADDLRRLQQIFEEGVNSTASRAIISTGTRTNTTRIRQTGQLVSRTNAVAEAHPAETLVHGAIQKVPVSHLVILGAVLVVVLIAGAQLKLFVASPRLERIEASLPDVASNGPAQPLSGTSIRATSAVKAPVAATAPLPPSKVTKPKPRKKHAAAPVETDSAKPPEIVIPFSNVDVAVQHQFKDATLFVWVDDHLALTRTLHGGPQKHLIVFNGVRGIDSETIRIPAGKHALRVRALSTHEAIDISKTIWADFAGGAEKSLRVTFEKRNSIMRLSWE